MEKMNLENRLKAHIEILCQLPRTPGSEGYKKTQDYLRVKIRELDLPVYEQEFPVSGGKTGTNIYTRLNETTTSSPHFLFGAHYETRDCSGVGADDNGSAVAVLLELIELFKNEKSYRFTMIFFDFEELYRFSGLRGSRYFAKTEGPLDAVIILDLVGGVFAPKLENTYLQFGNAFPNLSTPELEFLHMPMKFLEPLGPLAARSDYAGFRKRGTLFSFLTSGTPWYYHTPQDTPEILEYTKMATFTNRLKELPALYDKKNHDQKR